MNQERDTGRAVSRRDLLRLGLAAGGVAAGVPMLAACGSGSSGGAAAASSGGGKLVIGAFEDGALVPFREKILPLFKQATGIEVTFLTEPYDAFFAKAFQDGQSKAGQYDIYIMDDPWIPQYAAAGILEDLGQQGIQADADYAQPFIDLGYWPPRQGPRIKGFRERHAEADRAAHDRRPADHDLPQRHLLLRPRHLG